jgi:hypothetical protein
LFSPIVLLGFAVVLEACATPSQERLMLKTRVELVSEQALAFTTPLGWSVALDKAVLATGPFAYFEGAPWVAARESGSPLKLARRFFGIAPAHAHPGHYHEGAALGAMLAPFSVDLVADSAAYPDGEGVTGTYRSASFSFASPASGPHADALAHHVAVVEGSAEKDGESPRSFRAVASWADIEGTASGGAVVGCTFAETNVNDHGTVTLAIEPAVWFALVDFAELEPAEDDSPREFPDASQPKLAFVQGLATSSAYSFRYSTP